MEAFRLGVRLALPLVLRNRVTVRQLGYPTRWVSSSSNDSGSKNTGKYKEFKDEDSTEILDVFEERLKIAESISKENDVISDDDEPERVHRLDVEELVTFIRNNRGKDLTVLQLPLELKYVDYLIIVTCKSTRHIQGLGESIRKYTKERLTSMKNVPQLEGSESDWIALDLGNICIHIMSRTLRGTYDLESLWGIGPKYDVMLNQKDDDIFSLLKKHSFPSLGALDEKETTKIHDRS